MLAIHLWIRYDKEGEKISTLGDFPFLALLGAQVPGFNASRGLCFYKYYNEISEIQDFEFLRLLSRFYGSGVDLGRS